MGQDPNAQTLCNTGEVLCTEELQATGMNCILGSCQHIFNVPRENSTQMCNVPVCTNNDHCILPKCIQGTCSNSPSTKSLCKKCFPCPKKRCTNGDTRSICSNP